MPERQTRGGLMSVGANAVRGAGADPSAEAAALADALSSLRSEMRALEADAREPIASLHASHVAGGRNLAHYLALRRHDLRPLQRRLAALGLSSLGRAESHVLAAVDAVLHALGRTAGKPPLSVDVGEPPVGIDEGARRLAANTETLLGPPPPARAVRIMVTMPGEAADDPALVRKFLEQGMNCMRVNCAHDAAPAWHRMIAHLRRAEKETGLRCRVLMDLAGPKLRTGPVDPGPAVLKVRPQRDEFGRVTAPARLWLTPCGVQAPPPSSADACLPLPADWLAGLNVGDRIRLRDARRARRSLTVTEKVGGCRWAAAEKTCYLMPGTRLRVGKGRARARIGPVPRLERKIPLAVGDRLVLTRELAPGSPALPGTGGTPGRPAQVGCTPPELFTAARAGDRIFLDDGKFAGVLESVGPDSAAVRITGTPPGGGKLAAEKGINLPDTDLRISALTDKDLEDLDFVAANADMVGASFVRSAEDVDRLQEQLARRNAGKLGIVLKIETCSAFEQLPELLWAVMRNERAGVMIARGDLAVECGYERLAEVQEEILWICEAAHVPVVWATQVLEGLAKEGLPSRAEITDAAMGVRAECVMLNKGPRMLDAIRTLDDILRRMEAHQAKKTSMLRRLRSWMPEA